MRSTAPFKVSQLTDALEAAYIETRPIICGNIARQPAIKLYQHRAHGDLKHATEVMERAFSFGNHQAINDNARNYVVENVRLFLRKNGAI